MRESEHVLVFIRDFRAGTGIDLEMRKFPWNQTTQGLYSLIVSTVFNVPNYWPHSFIHSTICSFIHSLFHLFIHPSINPSGHSLTNSCIHLPIHLSISSSIHSFINPSTHSFIHSSIHSVHSLLLYPFENVMLRHHSCPKRTHKSMEKQIVVN